MTTVSVTEARVALSDLVDRVVGGEEVTLTRHGVAVAVLVRPDVLRVRRVTDARLVREILDAGGRSPLSAHPGLSIESAESLLADVRAGRSSG